MEPWSAGFTDVLKSLGLNPKKLPSNPPAKARRALHALQRIRTLYAIERRIRDASPEQRHRVRQAESVPVLDALRAWLDDTLEKVPPSSPLGKAMGLSRQSVAGAGALLRRRPIRHRHEPHRKCHPPVLLGRRSWLFADTVAGARASARLYSLVQCAKANGLEPYAYLRRVFTELPQAQSLGDIEALLPTRLTPADLI